MATIHMPSPTYDSPQSALMAMIKPIVPVATECKPLHCVSGRVLRQSVVADRDSPAADVSAMDGYALRIADLVSEGRLSVQGESLPGQAPPTLLPGKIVRIFTGAVVPNGADLVIQREQTDERPESVGLLPPSRQAKAGLNIRRQGENATQGSVALLEGQIMHPGAIAVAANFGVAMVTVSCRVRVTIIVTGDELHSVDQSVEAWQLRDSNGPTLAALLESRPWINVVNITSVGDSLPRTEEVIAEALRDSDAVVMTGGVSMGDYDHVPTAVARCGMKLIFHKLPIRPGKPILGAVTSQGQPLIGLPGNPVSAIIGARRFLLPLLGHLAKADPQPLTKLSLASPPSKTLPLHWMRLVSVTPDGNALLVPSQGSGDLVSLAASTGFIEQPPHADSIGPWPYWPWSD